MRRGVLIGAAAALVLGGALGCSSGPGPARPEPGAISPGTAQLRIDDRRLDSTAVRCDAIDTYTQIHTGDESSGVTVMLVRANHPTVEFVRIRNVGGFTGDYDRGLQGDAAVTMTSATYDISGVVIGYSQHSNERRSAPFAIRVAC